MSFILVLLQLCGPP